MMRRRRKPPPPPAEVPAVPPVTTYAQALAGLRALGFEPAVCAPLCRRKAEHRHMRHGSGTAELIVFPGTQ